MADKYTRLPDWLAARAGLAEKRAGAVAAMTKVAMTKAAIAEGSDEVDSSGETISSVPRNPFRDSCDKAAGTVVHASG